MENKKQEKLVRVLRVLVVITFICNIAALFFVPLLTEYSPKELVEVAVKDFSYLFDIAEATDPDHWPIWIQFILSFVGVWYEPYMAVQAVFLWICGACTAIILWQAKKVLDMLRRRTPFVPENARYLRRAAICCFVISFASACRTVWGFFYYRSLRPLLTYNFLFCPLFLMGGLLFLVMSTLFRQAAEMKTENDLTI